MSSTPVDQRILKRELVTMIDEPVYAVFPLRTDTTAGQVGQRCMMFIVEASLAHYIINGTVNHIAGIVGLRVDQGVEDVMRNVIVLDPAQLIMVVEDLSHQRSGLSDREISNALGNSNETRITFQVVPVVERVLRHPMVGKAAGIV
jgi:hypothetical protein